ncbi:hypothetical protein [Sphingobacterium sp. LRF_L2]|uniref:hypothetical protein n=1 Tax=Sphingobacterium sp. LRF_L2 TaxID=3369421 RepID=UPI003F5E5EEC
MKYLKALILCFTCTLAPSLLFSQTAMSRAEETLLEIQEILLRYGATEHGIYEKFEMTLEGDITILASDEEGEEHVIQFKLGPKLSYVLKNDAYVFTEPGNKATITNEEDKESVSSTLVSLKYANKEIADRLTVLFNTMDQSLKDVKTEAEEKEKIIKENKVNLYQKIKNMNIQGTFTTVTLPNTPNKESKSYTLFKNPLQLNGLFYSGFAFTPKEDGYLYWYFQAPAKLRPSFFIADTDKTIDDSAIRYFRKMAYVQSTDPALSSWVVQKSNEKLKKGKTYVLWFESSLAVDTPQTFKASFQLQSSDEQKVGDFFKDQFPNVLNDF